MEGREGRVRRGWRGGELEGMLGGEGKRGVRVTVRNRISVR